MSRSNWLYYLAFGLSLALTFSASAQDGKNGEQHPGQRQAEAKQTPADPPAAPAAPAVTADKPQPQRNPETYGDPCKNPKYGSESDLCQQWRMAEAAEETADWTYGQMLATGIEAILLAIAIGVASWAGFWAKRAAIATAETAQIASDTAERQLRAYIHIKNPTITINEDKSVEVNIPAHNAGQTPAHQMIWNVRAKIAARRPDPKIKNNIPSPDGETGVDLAGGGGANHPQTTTVPDIEKLQEAIAKDETGYFIYGTIKYRDIFDKGHVTKFLLVYSGPWKGVHDLLICKTGNAAD